MRGLEITFQVPEEARLPLQRALRSRGARATRRVAGWFDTEDGCLARHGLSLQLRREGRRWFQTLEASRLGPTDGAEHSVVVRVAAGTRPVPDPALHDGTEAGDRLRKALGAAPPGALVERFTSDVSRLAVTLPSPDGEVEAALLVGELRAGEHARRLCELELAPGAGSARSLLELACWWRAQGGGWLEARSMARRGLLLAHGRPHAEAVKAHRPVLADDMGGDGLARAVVHAVLDQVLGNASELAAGSGDEAHVHQLRVGLRRLRTALRELSDLAQDVDPSWEPALALTFGRLGGIRDDDSVAAAVRGLLQQADAPKLAWPPSTTDADAAGMVRDAAFQDTLLSIRCWSLAKAAPHSAVGDGGQAAPAEPVRQHLVRRLAALHRQVFKAGKRFEQLPTQEQHRVRKRLKRLRYLAEFVSSLWGHKATQRYLKRLTPAQDALGRHNDVVVAEEKFRADAQRDPLSLYAAGYLRAHQAFTAREARQALVDAAAAPKFWKR